MMRKGSSRKLKMLTTMLLLVVELMLGAGNWPLMRMPCWGTPRGEMVPYVTFQVKNRYGSSARATVAAATRHRRDTSVSRSIPRSLIGLPLHPLLHSSSQDYVIGFFFPPFFSVWEEDECLFFCHLFQDASSLLLYSVFFGH